MAAAVAACDPVGAVLGCADEPPPPPQPPPIPPVPPVVEPPPEPAPAPQPPTPEQASARLVALMNEERAATGLAALSSRGDVADIAFAHSTAMAAAGDIWHNDAYFTRESHDRLQARSLGENVALNRDVDDAHRRLMASPEHRANILNGSFTIVGVGVATDEGGRYYITENFVEPKATRPVPAAKHELPRDQPGESQPAPGALEPAHPPFEVAAPVDVSWSELGAWPTRRPAGPDSETPMPLAAFAVAALGGVSLATRRHAFK